MACLSVRKHYWLLVLVIAFCSCCAYGQGGTWVWMNGSNQPNANAVFGLLGVPDTANTPSELYEAPNWIDAQGNFWIFGGVRHVLNIVDAYSDLWKYDPTNNTWTWVKGPGTPTQEGVYGVKGVPSLSNNPGARAWGCFSWTDGNGDFWLYGGDGLDAAGTEHLLNDLWRYNIANNEWTWMNGDSVLTTFSITSVYGNYQQFTDSTNPGSTWEETSAWVHNGNTLWLYDALDLWEYDILINQWAWMKGPQLQNYTGGHYGIMGVADSLNLPPARSSFASWQDANGHFYIFGGGRTDPNDDVWKFDATTTDWTWVGGNQLTNDTGLYGLYCDTSYSPRPKGRYENRSPKAIGCYDAFLAFGGTKEAIWTYNDLWLYNLQNNNWTLISGNSNFNTAGVYGMKGVPDVLNLPPARAGACLWFDGGGNLWAFGGSNYASGAFNDMWKFVPDTTCFAILYNAPVPVSTKGDTLIAPDALSYQWYLNGSPLTGDTTKNIIVVAGGSYTVKVTYSYGCSGLSTPIIITSISQVEPGYITVYPNPSTGSWILKVDNNLLGSPMEVFDATGRRVFTSIITNQQSAIDLANEASGVYELRITSHQSNIVWKLVKM